MFKTFLLTATATGSAIVVKEEIVKEFFSYYIDPAIIPMTGIASLVLLVYKALNEAHKYNNRKKQSNEGDK
jgi:hypothetical protein